MLAPIHHLKTLGVINVTPNSFSDPKKFLNTHFLKNKLTEYAEKKNIIFDFGFESTAPMNTAITQEEERQRFDLFFDEIKDIDLSGCWISFDTYRPLNFKYFKEKMESRYKGQGFILNDVSGVIDDELLELLLKERYSKNFFYLYSFTHIPSRVHVLNHMDYVKTGPILETCIESFKKGIDLFKKEDLLDHIILDPCFGFSKTFDQNWELLNRLNELFSALAFKGPWVIGISKKSFLRKMFEQSSDPYLESEFLHQKIIQDLLEKKWGHLIFRVHDFDIVQRVEKNLSHINNETG